MSQVTPRPPAAAEPAEDLPGDGEQTRATPVRTAPSRPPVSRSLPLIARLVIGLGAIAFAVAVAALLVATRKQAHQAPFEETVRRVGAVVAQPQPADSIVRTWEGFGTARARDRAEVAAEAGGRIVERPAAIEPGNRVEAGDVLARIDEADYLERLNAARSAVTALAAQLESVDVETSRLRDQVAQAQSQLDLTNWELERYERARDGAAANEMEIVRLRSTLARLEGDRLRVLQQLETAPLRRQALAAEIEARRNDAALAERNLARTAIRSPIGGMLQAVHINTGEMVQAGQPVARVVSLERIEVPISLPAAAQGELRLGDDAELLATGSVRRAGRSPSWRARIARIGPEADPRSRMITAFLEVEQATPMRPEEWSPLLMPGRFVTARIRGRAASNGAVFVVPRRAVADDRVWIALADEAGKARAQPRPVRVLFHFEGSFPHLDASETQWTAVADGLAPGDVVIVTNLDELAPGSRVEPDGSHSRRPGS